MVNKQIKRRWIIGIILLIILLRWIIWNVLGKAERNFLSQFIITKASTTTTEIGHQEEDENKSNHVPIQQQSTNLQSTNETNNLFENTNTKTTEPIVGLGIKTNNWNDLRAFLSNSSSNNTNSTTKINVSTTTESNNTTESTTLKLSSSSVTATTTRKKYRFCNQSEIRHGSWKPVEYPDGSIYKPINYHNLLQTCFSEQRLTPFKTDPTLGPPWRTFDWVPFHSILPDEYYNHTQNLGVIPSTLINTNQTNQGTFVNDDDKCVFLPFLTPRAYCSILIQIAEKSNNNTSSPFMTIAFMGDSLMLELYQSMAHMLGVPSRQVYRFPNVMACNGHIRLVSGGGVHLSDLPLHLEQYRPNIIVLNRGAHHVPDDQFEMEMTETLQVLKNYTTTSPIYTFWKTTTPGHPSCWLYSHPSDSVSDMQNLIRNESLYTFHPGAPNFHWWKFEPQTQLVLKLISTMFPSSSSSMGAGGTIDILDAHDLLIGRPDAHRGRKGPRRMDCLHHCLLGPVDTIIRLLFHYLYQKIHDR